jgi:ABC-type branched-subunit amino acid transport system ATPase component
MRLLALAARAYVLEGGSFVLTGPAAGPADDPALKRSHLGT